MGKIAFFGMVAGIVAYVLSLLLSSNLKGIGILFLRDRIYFDEDENKMSATTVIR